MSMKILITGAGGFIGGFIVEEALSRGYETWAGLFRNHFCFGYWGEECRWGVWGLYRLQLR